VDRSDWKKRAYTAHADLLELKQRVDPLARTLAFVEIFQPERKGVRQNLSRTDIIQLIMQHLHSIGLKATAVALEKECQIKCKSKAPFFFSPLSLSFPSFSFVSPLVLASQTSSSRSLSKM
jgi:hypothetical protein